MECKSCELFDRKRHTTERVCKSGDGGRLLISGSEVCLLFQSCGQALTVQLMHSLPDLSITLPSGNLAPQGPPGHSGSQSTSKVPVIIGTIFGFIGLILLFVVVLSFLRQRRRESSYIDGPPEELRARQQGPSNITPFTDESKPHIANGLEPSSGYFVLGNPPSPTRQIAPTGTDIFAGEDLAVSSSRDEGNTPGDDGQLREEVQELLMRVEMLSAQPPHVHVVILPDEPPPVYPNPQ